MTSEVYNPETRAREIFLTVILPDTAFISRFAIEMGGQLFVAYVREKENAWKEYQEAVSQGKTAGRSLNHNSSWFFSTILTKIFFMKQKFSQTWRQCVSEAF